MLIYIGTKSSFMKDVRDDYLTEKLEQTIYERMNRRTPKAELRSWINSMQFMYNALDDKDIPENSGVAIEYNIPLTAKRVDFIVSGYNSKGQRNAEIIELKQWESAEVVDNLEAVVRTYVGGGIRDTTHPSYQAWSYASMIANYNESVQKGAVALHPCVFAHNYPMNGTCALEAPCYQPYVEKAPIFGKHEASKLAEFIKKDIQAGDRGEILKFIDHGKLHPSKSLQDNLVSLLQGNPEFILIDSQKVVYEKALQLAIDAKKNKTKVCYIVKGGPGTGKSVIAINLLAKLTSNDQVVSYVTKNSAPRSVYSTVLKGTRRKTEIDLMFKGSASFVDKPKNCYDTLVVDEAHRLMTKTIYNKNGENQIKEILNSAWCSIFFIDEKQRVHIQDIGSVREIKKQAARLGIKVVIDELDSQFRCNGSDGYLAWVDDVLEIRETANKSLEGLDYDLRVFDDPSEMEAEIKKKNQARNKARISAGYCWDWPKKNRADTNYHDIRIGDWGISWNLENSTTFAIDDNSVNEAGCIHTVQGLEFDYTGVIIGPDLRYEKGHVITDYTKRSSTDRSLFGIKKMMRENPDEAIPLADEIIRNTYRTLLTRGMKGCYIYCCDKPLADYLRKRIEDYDVFYDENFEVSGLQRI